MSSNLAPEDKINSNNDINILDNQDIFAVSNSFISSNFLHLEDNVPNIQYKNSSLSVEISSSSNTSWQDHNGYFTTFGQEIDFIAKIETLVNKGTELIHTLYTYRSVSQAIPEISMEIPKNISSIEEAEMTAKRIEINRKILDILRPEMKKLKEFIAYTLEAISLFHGCITHLTNKESHNELIPEGIYLSVIKLADVMLILDTLKDIKTCFKNDFSRYKRVVGAHPSIEILEEISQLQTFYSNPDPRKATHYLFLNLRDEVKRVNGHEIIFLDILELAMKIFEKNEFVTPEEKFRIIRIVPYFMLMADGEADEAKSLNIFKTNKIKISKLQNIFKKYPILPLYGDMSLSMELLLQRSQHYERGSLGSLWGHKDVDSFTSVYDLKSQWESIRTSYSQYMTRFTAAINRHRKYPFRKVLDAVTIEMSSVAFHLVKDGFLLLSAWTSQLKLLLSWKYLHPCSLQHLETLQVSASSQAIEYGRVLRFNLSREELSAMVDVISMIKSLSGLMDKSEAILAPHIRFHVHHSIQKLVLTDLVPLLHRVDKRNKPILPTLLKVRSLVADWGSEVAINAEQQQKDYKSYSRNKELVEAKHPARVVGTAPTQLFILRTQVSSLFNSDSELRSKGSWFGKADLEKSDEVIFEKFYNESFYFCYVLNFSQTLHQVSDLGDLWYREYFLEMTKCIQFPVDMSLPWMLTEHMIMKHVINTPMQENVLFMLDIYNDAAHKALFILNQQFLYDEIEAEANLVIDQLYFLLSDEIYSHFKNLSSSVLLEKSLKNKLEILKTTSVAGSGDHLSVESRRVAALLSQRHIQLLGRTINFSFILGQNINNKIYRDIDFAIKRFESSDARGVIELKTFLDILANTHARLSQYLELDLFDSMLTEVNESFSPSNIRGRISVHMLSSLAKDIFPNCSYNLHTHRFVSSPIAIRHVQYSKAPKQSKAQAFGSVCSKEFEMCARLTRGFLGRPHIEAYLSLGASISDLSMLIDQCLKHLYDRIIDVKEYLVALKDGIPPCAPPKFLFKTLGGYGYYEGKLRSILTYDDLKPEVFQNFREIGNTIAFLKDLSDVLELYDQFDFMLIAPFLAVIPGDKGTSPSSSTTTTTNTANEMSVLESSPLLKIVNYVSKSVRESKELQAEAVVSQDVWKRMNDVVQRIANNSAYAIGSKDEPLSFPASKNSNSLGKCLIHWVMLQIEDFIYQENLSLEWASLNSSNDNINDSNRSGTNNNDPNTTSNKASPYFALSVQNATGFHRLWSALSFLFCTVDSELDQDESQQQSSLISNEAEFGHGFTIAGCMLLHILGQRTIFETMDFSRYVLHIDTHEQRMKVVGTESSTDSSITFKASLADRKSSSTNSISLGNKVDASLLNETKGFLIAAKTQQLLQNEIFALFESIHKPKDSYTKHSKSNVIFHPPNTSDY